MRIAVISFSPTRTTSRVLDAVVPGLSFEPPTRIDLTLPAALPAKPVEIEADVALIGVPVYFGRVPRIARERLELVHGRGTPAAVVAVYGNRAYEDALIELFDLAVARGFAPVAAAAFVGEHSYADLTRPVALGRPDGADQSAAEAFGAAVRAKLAAATDPAAAALTAVPGERPYRAVPEVPCVAPQTDPEACILCGACADACPTGVVRVDEAVSTEDGGCIMCCACVKICPTRARLLADPHVEEVRDWLLGVAAQRREPETFL